MKKKLKKLISDYINKYSDNNIKTNWREPIIAYADANDDLFKKLKKIISPSHALPQDFLPEAETVITYFLPFTETVIESNINGKYASRDWAIAYVETNQLIADINKYIKGKLNNMGYKSTKIPATYNFDEQELINDWSHRHIAYIAGLGKFGINNMLITEKGCCGRIGSLVTDLKLEPDTRTNKEFCLYKVDGSCRKCVDRCVNSALNTDDFDRHKCYSMLLENEKKFRDIGVAEVCGKCLVDLPCSFVNPVK